MQDLASASGGQRAEFSFLTLAASCHPFPAFWI
jgi:hypothetical protein